MTPSQQMPDLKSGKSGGSPTHQFVRREAGGEGEGSSGSSQGNTSPGRDDDMDEQVLYLRLMALKSLPEVDEVARSPKQVKEKSCLANSPKPAEEEMEEQVDDDDEMVNEMAELLDEVDQAADDQRPEPLNQAPMNIAAVIEKMKAAKKQNVKLTEEDLIIPNASPDSNRSPIGVEDPDDEEVTIVGEITGRLKVSDFARLFPRKDLFAVDDEVQIIDEPMSNCEPIDMEISCENEAEIQFFKDQVDPEKQKDALFPPSVWQIGALLNQPPPPPPPLPPPSISGSLMSNVMNFDSDEARYDAFLKAVFAKSENTLNTRKLSENRKRRKSEENRKESNIAISTSRASKKARMNETKKKTNKFVDEAESLRTNILISMIEKRKQKEKEVMKTKTVSRPTSSVLSKTNSECQKLSDQVIKMRHFPNLFKQVVISTAVSDEEDLDQHISSAPQNPIISSPDFSLNLENFLKGVRQETAKKRTTPPPKPVRKNPPGKVHSVKVKVATPQAKKLSNPALPKPPLSVAVKADLMTSTVSHLPLAKQSEYKRLKELIAKKERVKFQQQQQQKLIVKKQLAPTKVVINGKTDEVKLIEKDEETIDESKEVPSKDEKTLSETKVPSKDEKTNIDDDEDDAEMLRSKLLASLQVKKKQDTATLPNEKPGSPGLLAAKLPKAVVRKRITPPAKTIPVIVQKIVIPTQPAVASVSVAEQSAGAATAAPVPQEDETAKELLKKKEEELAAIQLDMMQEIFKLSAQMSQLKGETKNLEEARSFAEDLKQQLAETELIIERSNSRVDQLKTTVKSSIVDIVARRPAMVRMEEECKKCGSDIFGLIYKPPQAAGSQNIKKKLALIKTNAETLFETDDNPPRKTENAADKDLDSNEETILKAENLPVADNNSQLPPEESCEAASTAATAAPLETTETGEAIISEVENNRSETTIGEVEITTSPVENAMSEAKTGAVEIATLVEITASDTTRIGSTTTSSHEVVSSSLAHLRSSQVSQLDPHTQLCRFELQGKCNDDSCPYQHHTPKENRPKQ